MKDVKLGIIGAGNIARAIIGGLVDTGYSPASIIAADPSTKQLGDLPAGVRGTRENLKAVKDADVIILCVKPNLVLEVAQSFSGKIKGKLVISVAAGITTSAICHHLPDAAVIRCMPNTPALVGLAMTGMYANQRVTRDQKKIADTILSAIGETLWFDAEAELDVVTAVSGSGPAYFFYVMEAMELAATELGLAPEVARKLVMQTALGAATMASAGNDSPAVLRERVTSPGGTTEAALNLLRQSDLLGNFQRAVQAAYQRSIELAGTPGA